MPDRMHMLDTAYPNFEGMERTEDKLDAIQNYLFMLMEELRYLLRHLDADNFTDAGLRELAEGMASAEKEGGTASRYLAERLLALLQVNGESFFDRVSTSRRIRKYLLGDVSDDNYVKVQDQYVRWITGTILSSTGLLTEEEAPLLTEYGAHLTEEVGSAALAQATDRYGRPLYWQREPMGHTGDGYPLDRDGAVIYASADATAWPVVTYKYTETVKAQIAFEKLDRHYSDFVPQIILGAGDGSGGSRGYLYKDEDALRFRYVTAQGKNADIRFGEDGFVDAAHRRLAYCSIDRATGTVLYAMEGSSTPFWLSFTEDGDDVTFTWPDGHTCEVVIA